MHRYRCLVWLVFLCGRAQVGCALENVTLRQGERLVEVAGQVLIESQDGGVLLEDRAGILWAVKAEDLVARRPDDEPFRRWDTKEMERQLTQELSGFRTHTTAHYLIVYNTSQEYARWCGALFERLFLAFSTFWKQRGLALDDPPGPLIAVIFDTKQSFARYAQPELGAATAGVAGYYSLRTNRITMYDLTGLESLQRVGRVTSAEHINRILAQPQAEHTVATIIHEATHQLAFNCGLQMRYADIPLWVSEGIAVYFETPDLQSRRGWRSIDNVNRVRLVDFHRYAVHRTADSLRSLIADNDRFRNTGTAAEAYAEAWALNFFLFRQRQEDYIRYLQVLSQKKPLLVDEPQERLEAFTSVFGQDLGKFDTEFLRFMRSVR